MVVHRRLQFIATTELVGMARLGSLEAYDELVRRFRGAVLIVAQQFLGSSESAQDAAQETFLLAFRALPQLQEPAKFASWLYAIARRHAQRAATRQRQHETLNPDSLERLMALPDDSRAADPLDHLLHTERQATLRRLLSELPADLRLVLELFYDECWPAARIAEFLSLPLTTVKWRLRAGRKQLGCRFIQTQKENSHGRK